MDRDYVTAPSGTSSEAALKVLQEKKQMYLPIVAEDGTLVSPAALHDVLACRGGIPGALASQPRQKCTGSWGKKKREYVGPCLGAIIKALRT